MRKLLGLAMAVLLGWSATTAQAQNVTMRISHQVPTGHHLHKMLEAFAADVKQRSGGQIEVQIFPTEQLHKATENFPAVARGAVEAAAAVNFQWGNTIPEMNVTVIPYLFSDLNRIRKFPGSDAAKLLETKLEQHGVHNLMWLYITRESIFTSGKKPIIKLDDLQGMKIRGFNKLADTALTKLGASASAMPGSEVYNALQTGVLDAGITDISAAYSRRYYEVQKYGTVTPAYTVYFHIYVNPGWWKGLTQAQRDILQAAATTTEQDAIPITEDTAAEAIRQLKEKGMELHIQSDVEVAAWRDGMQDSVKEAFLKAAPQDGAKLIELLNKL
jgi:C4-dicarboxylate-binding protein DctP